MEPWNTAHAEPAPRGRRRRTGWVLAWPLLVAGWLVGCTPPAAAAQHVPAGDDRIPLQIPDDPAARALAEAILRRDGAWAHRLLTADPSLAAVTFGLDLPPNGPQPGRRLELNATQLALALNCPLDFVKGLIDAGIPPATRDTQGQPLPDALQPLTIALFVQHDLALATLLAQHGVPVDVPGDSGHTPLERACGIWYGGVGDAVGSHPLTVATPTALWLLDHGASPTAWHGGRRPVAQELLARLAFAARAGGPPNIRTAEQPLIRRLYRAAPQPIQPVPLLLFLLALGATGWFVRRHDRRSRPTPEAESAAVTALMQPPASAANWQGEEEPLMPEAEARAFVLLRRRWQRLQWATLPFFCAGAVAYSQARLDPYLSHIDTWGLIAWMLGALAGGYFLSWLPHFALRAVLWPAILVVAVGWAVLLPANEAWWMATSFGATGNAVLFTGAALTGAAFVLLGAGVAWLSVRAAWTQWRWRRALQRRGPVREDTGVEDRAGWDQGGNEKRQA
ncbi:MAG: hypothetical protein ACREJ2_14930 [Planctomycetota bacterium]